MLGVVFVERAQVGVHGLDVLPGRRHQHAQGAEHIHAAGDQDFQHVVETGGVRTGAVHQRRQLGQVGQQRVFEFRRARHRPVAVSRDGVDLAVVGEITEGLRQRPARQRVGGETLVEYDDMRLQARIGKIAVEARQVRRHYQALVGNDAGRQRRNIEKRIALQLLFGAAASQEQPAVQGNGIETGTVDENLLEHRQRAQRNLAQDGRVYRHLAPASHLQAFFFEFAIQHFAGLGGQRRIGVQENEAGTETVGQLNAELGLGDFTKKAFRHGQQHAAAIACLAVGGNRAAMGHARERMDGSLDELVTGRAFHMGNQAESAVIAELVRLVETKVLDRLLVHQFLPLKTKVYETFRNP